MASAWLTGAGGAVEGVLIPGLPAGRTAELVMSLNSVSARTEHVRGELSWDQVGKSWSLAHWAVGEGAGIGVAIRADGESAKQLDAVLADVRSRRHHIIDQINAATLGDEVALPLFTPRTARARVEKERTTLGVLCRLLSDRPELRHRLHEVERMNALLAEVREGASRQLVEKLHIRPGRVDIRNAMNALGLIHHYGGRPIPDGSPIRPKDEAIDAVLGYIARNKYAALPAPSRAEIANLLDREYYSIKPWPFSPLFA